ncbi:unnamed protein product [Symbiodinium sp. CCMP2592]|nr:unnamed protein product [Symbiodinium sp. CCMP2592]
MTQEAIEQRLRRACTNGKRKSATGGAAAVEMYKDLGKRDKLAKILIQSNFSKSGFRKNITKFVEKEKSSETKVVAGWYTEHAAEMERMAESLEHIYDKMAHLQADLKKAVHEEIKKGWPKRLQRRRRASPSEIRDIEKANRLHSSGCALPVKIEMIEAGPAGEKESIPWLDPVRMMTCLAENDMLDLLHGDHNLLEFWRRYAKYNPSHPIFTLAENGVVNLARSIPFYSHGDEGRGKKKKGILIWSMKGAVGRGTDHFRSQHDVDQQKLRMGLNMTGSKKSRFLHLAVPKQVYAKMTEPVWDDLAFHIARSYHQLQTKGFDDCHGRHWHAICLGLTGDNPFLAKVGHLQRSFARGPKSSGETATAGICWHCLAGTPNIPYENFAMKPEWSFTLYECLPWEEQPPFLQGLQYPEDDDLAPQMLHFDVWHNFHGGVAKHMVASTVAEILPNMMSGGIKDKVEQINKAYTSWRRESKLTLHCGRLDAELFGVDSGLQVCPEGKWNKFNDSRILLAFLEFFLAQRTEYVPTHVTEEALFGIKNANLCFSTLYRSGFWLTPQEASLAGKAGMNFLCSYSRLASFTLEEERSRYPLVPKTHYLHHAFLEMCVLSTKSSWIPSALATSVQIDEDFVGVVSRTSRRVGSFYLMKRTLQRYLVTAYLETVESVSPPK